MSGEKLDELRQMLQQGRSEASKRRRIIGAGDYRRDPPAQPDYPSRVGSHARSKVAVTTHKGAEPGPRSVWPRELPPGPSGVG
jgi:hypothetical protein